MSQSSRRLALYWIVVYSCIFLLSISHCTHHFVPNHYLNIISSSVSHLKCGISEDPSFELKTISQLTTSLIPWLLLVFAVLLFILCPPQQWYHETYSNCSRTHAKVDKMILNTFYMISFAVNFYVGRVHVCCFCWLYRAHIHPYPTQRFRFPSEVAPLLMNGWWHLGGSTFSWKK